MNDRERLQQLRGMLDRLERMPASPDRDWMLSEVRARAVDVESGMPAGPMRRLPSDEADLEIAESRTVPRKASRCMERRSASGPTRARLARPAPLIAAPERAPRAAREAAVDLLAGDTLLCLDDA